MPVAESRLWECLVGWGCFLIMKKERIPFGKLIFIGDTVSVKKGRWGKYLCFCGNEFDAVICEVNSGRKKSCGCMYKKHGDTKDRLYKIYHKIKWRCYYPTNSWYSDYGGRGIKMCAEWENNYVNFKEWALANGYHHKLTIDRIDNDKNYEPDNCRWISQKLQNINQRMRKDNKSGYAGVQPSGIINYPWKAVIAINKKNVILGTFKTPELANEAYQKAKKEREELYLKEEKDIENINYRKVAKIKNAI